MNHHSVLPLKIAGFDYSTAEQDTGKKWIDGKTIYKKTINVAPLPSSTVKNTPHNISGLNLVIFIEAFRQNPVTNYTSNMPATSANVVTNQIETAVSGNNVSVVTGFNASAYTIAFVTLYYTKTS